MRVPPLFIAVQLKTPTYGLLTGRVEPLCLYTIENPSEIRRASNCVYGPILTYPSGRWHVLAPNAALVVGCAMDKKRREISP